jgi:hypothetical protein
METKFSFLGSKATFILNFIPYVILEGFARHEAMSIYSAMSTNQQNFAVK